MNAVCFTPALLPQNAEVLQTLSCLFKQILHSTANTQLQEVTDPEEIPGDSACVRAPAQGLYLLPSQKAEDADKGTRLFQGQ